MVRAPSWLKQLPVNRVGLAVGVLTTSTIALSGQFTQRYWPLASSLTLGLRISGWLLASILFLLLLRRAQEGFTIPMRKVMLVSVVLAAPFFLTQPVLAGDLYAYIASVKIGALGNPYVLTPASLGDDPIRAGIFDLWQNWPMTYGPLWGLLVKGLSFLTTDALVLLFTFRLIGLGAIIGSTWLISRATSASRAALLAWSPIVLVEVVGDGHNDLLVGLALLIAMVFSQRPVRSALGAAVSIAIKYVPLITLPIFVTAAPPGSRLRRTVILAGVTLVGFVICIAPFWVGLQTFTGFREQATLFTLPVFFPQFLIFLAAYFHGGSWHPEVIARALGIAGFIVAWLAICWFTWRRVLTLTVGIILSLSAYLLLAASYVQTWYVLWLLPIVLLLRTRHALRWTAIISIVWAAMQLIHPPV